MQFVEYTLHIALHNVKHMHTHVKCSSTWRLAAQYAALAKSMRVFKWIMTCWRSNIWCNYSQRKKNSNHIQKNEINWSVYIWIWYIVKLLNCLWSWQTHMHTRHTFQKLLLKKCCDLNTTIYHIDEEIVLEILTLAQSFLFECVIFSPEVLATW